MTASTTMRTRMRGKVYISLVAAAMAAMVTVGAGAAGAGNVRPPEKAPNSGLSYWWQVTYDTDDAVWGDFYRQADDFVSGIGWPKTVPAHSWTRTQQKPYVAYREYVWGRICYRGAWWNLPRDVYSGGPSMRLHPAASDANILTLSFNEMDGSSGHEAALIKTPSYSGC